MSQLLITSPAFKNNKLIPRRYTCDGDNVNPPLDIDRLPDQTKSLVLIVDDPDASFRTWEHWNVWNIAPTNNINENSNPGTEGLNDFGRHSYRGPCPPTGVHRYFFKVYALDAELSLPTNSRKKDIEKALSKHILAKGELIGLYKR